MSLYYLGGIPLNIHSIHVGQQRRNKMMRAKMVVETVSLSGVSETVNLRCVPKSSSYPTDGSDEDNTFAKFSPSGSCTIQVANPALFGKLRPGQKFYLDFTLVDAPDVVAG